MVKIAPSILSADFCDLDREIRRIAPAPVPSYAVPAPYPFCGNNGCGGCC